MPAGWVLSYQYTARSLGNNSHYPFKKITIMAENRSRGTSRRGFASMDPETQRQIARQGGRAAHQMGVAHEFTSSEAREAGRKGGQARRNKNRGTSPDSNDRP